MAEPDVGQLLGADQMTSGDANDILIVTIDTAQTSGRTVYAAFGSLSQNRAISSVTDTKSGTWTAIRNVQNITNAETYLYARISGAALEVGDTVSADYNGTTHALGIVIDAVGSATSESAGGQQGTTSASPSVAITRTLTNSLTIAAVTENAADIDADLTNDADYTTVHAAKHTGANLRLTVSWRDQTGAGGDTYAPTLSGSRAVATVVSDFGLLAVAAKGGLIPMTGAGG